jgi:hypothetical protein
MGQAGVSSVTFSFLENVVDKVARDDDSER